MLMSFTFALGVLLAGCGSETEVAPATTPSATSVPEPTELSCPDNMQVGTDGGLLAKMPNGFDTPEEAVEDWLSGNESSDDNYVLARDGSGAWILRDDGTAHTRVEFLRHSGYTVHGYQACSG